MLASFNDPFETLFALQRALDARTASDWMERGTAAIGSFPPINIFQKNDDFVAVVELPGINKNDLEIEARKIPSASVAERRLPMASRRAFIVASVSRACLTGRYRCQFGSNRVASRPNIATACWRC